jgi:anti-anti-sigma factor
MQRALTKKEFFMLNITTEENGEAVVLHCAGKIVRGDETALLCAGLGQQGRNIDLDLNDVAAIDAAGVGALISLQAAGIYLRLMNPNKAVREVLRMTKLDSVFEICGDPLAAISENQNRREARPKPARPKPSLSSLPSPCFAAAT